MRERYESLPVTVIAFWLIPGHHGSLVQDLQAVHKPVDTAVHIRHDKRIASAPATPPHIPF